jgi:hypothetical protein
MGTIHHDLMRWVPVDDAKPLKGATVVAFTPVWGSLRFRVVSEDLLHTLSEATHWAYLVGPQGDPSN